MRYVVGILIAIGLAILVIVVLFKLIFGGGGAKPQITTKPLTDYANTSVTMQFTIDGNVTADQNHREIVINVGQSQSYVDVIQGYQNNVISNTTFNNNEAAYFVFLQALDRAGFTLGNSSPQLANEQGRCALGNRYIVEILQGNQDLEHYWATSCGGVRTFNGSLSLVRSLFIKQIPNYNRVISGVNLSQ